MKIFNKINSALVISKIYPALLTGILSSLLVIPVGAKEFSIPDQTPQVELLPWDFLILRLIAIFIVYFVVSAFLLSVSYLILRRRKIVKSLKFFKYIFLAAAGGFIIDILIWGPVGSLDKLETAEKVVLPSKLMVIILLASFFFIFLGIGFYNYWLSRIFFEMSKREYVFVAIVMAIFVIPFCLLFPISFLRVIY